MEDMHASREPAVLNRCGHAMHAGCAREHFKRDFKCPVCCASAGDMTAAWRRLDVQLAEMPMPPELAKWVRVACNDCHCESWSRWHIDGIKCRGFPAPTVTAAAAAAPALPAAPAAAGAGSASARPDEAVAVVDAAGGGSGSSSGSGGGEASTAATAGSPPPPSFTHWCGSYNTRIIGERSTDVNLDFEARLDEEFTGWTLAQRHGVDDEEAALDDEGEEDEDGDEDEEDEDEDGGDGGGAGSAGAAAPGGSKPAGS